MVSEIGDVNFDDPYLKWDSASAASHTTCNFHDQIFSRGGINKSMAKNVAFHTVLNNTDEKTRKTICFSRMGYTGSADVRFTYEWGDPEGPSISGSASGNIRDDHGNKAEAEVKVNSDGSGSASVSVSHND